MEAVEDPKADGNAHEQTVRMFDRCVRVNGWFRQPADERAAGLVSCTAFASVTTAVDGVPLRARARGMMSAMSVFSCVADKTHTQ